MTIRELIAELTKRNPDVEIVIACEHDHAFQHDIIAVSNREDGRVAIYPAS